MAYVTAETFEEAPQRRVSAGLVRLALVYVWITIASIGIVFSEPAPFDALMCGAIVLLPVMGMAPFTRGLSLYVLLWAAIVAGSYIAATQASVIGEPATHTTITLYLALSSVVMAAFVAARPEPHIRLIMSAYMVAAVIAAVAGLIGYFGLFGTYDLFTEFGRARGTFKDPNVMGAFLAPAVLYAFNMLLTARAGRALLWALPLPLLLLATLLTFSRGAWINMVLSLGAYAFFIFATSPTNLRRLKLLVCIALAGAVAVGILAAAQTMPKVAELMGERATFEQSYDVGPEGRFGGQRKAVGLIASHPLGIGALEFSRSYHPEDVHEVYLSMFLNGGWVGGTFYLALVLITLLLGLRVVIQDRSGSGLSSVLFAAFIGMALEGIVIDTDHWRHFYLLMAMIWGMALAAPAWTYAQRRSGHAPLPG
jgi:hypothetical protein